VRLAEKVPPHLAVRLEHNVSDSYHPLAAHSGSEHGDTPSLEAISAALAGVIDPELGADIVDLGMVRGIELDGDEANIQIALTVASCPLRNQLQADVVRHVEAVPGVKRARVTIGVMGQAERSALMARARRKAQEGALATDISPTAKVIAVASGKGGVGKSSISVNLATALARRGLSVGLLDADIWGHSVPRLLAMKGSVEARAGKMIPLERDIGAGRLKVISMGFLSGEQEAIMWRGLILTRAVQHFLEDVSWGELDYLLIDLPPGTGDVQMGLARMVPQVELLIVTTPNLAAQVVAGRVADMARRGHVRVAGVIENMSAFTCEHGETHALFGSGGGQRLAEQLGVPLVGSVPLDSRMADSPDARQPIALQSDGMLADLFATIARRVVTEISPLNEMADCSARLLGRLESVLGAVESRSTS